jgi:hypothetical protein
VPSCSECNHLAGDKPFKSIREKRRYIQGRLRKRYRKQLINVIWDADELEEIGHSLQAYIVRGQRERARIELRLTWPYSNSIVRVTEMPRTLMA